MKMPLVASLDLPQLGQCRCVPCRAGTVWRAAAPILSPVLALRRPPSSADSPWGSATLATNVISETGVVVSEGAVVLVFMPVCLTETLPLLYMCLAHSLALSLAFSLCLYVCMYVYVCLYRCLSVFISLSPSPSIPQPLSSSSSLSYVW